MKYLLDTNIISELISKKPNEKVLNFVNNLNPDDVYLSAVTIGEIQAGIQSVQSKTRKKSLEEWLHEDLFKKFENRIVSIDVNTMLTWGNTNHSLKKLGKPLPIMDSIIGATCISKNFILITRNEKDFQNLDIEIINPF
ncbi:MAG: type II toxin-antitoxin system VapC family toxin [Campylobacterota bacterium]